ncbi:cell division protein FtsL [Rhodoferax aquaticus]|uniref:Cell division protein FtsL n=1 Tax=Rhodoferax aquaticus TaxID=2527691 RepID=A0A515ELI0_9BURK|nr:cell division protein FtsL [Rhodoferax aquaticus]QDL53517.1 cell division protein FtsL [Rhodoferax aquaticus]
MMRLNLMLIFAVLLSALYLVNVQYESRRLFTELDRARSEAHRLEVEHELLQVQKRAQATPARVELLAKDKLQMRQVTPGITSYVTYSAPDASISDGTAATASQVHKVAP